MKNRRTWVLVRLAAVATAVSGAALVFCLLRPYCAAKYRGRDAVLRGAMLLYAPLAGADLSDANLHGANLHGANLEDACLFGADLRGADLTGANLTRTEMGMSYRNNFYFTQYDTHTRWPAGFDPFKHGAALCPLGRKTPN